MNRHIYQIVRVPVHEIKYTEERTQCVYEAKKRIVYETCQTRINDSTANAKVDRTHTINGGRNGNRNQAV